MPSPTTGSNSQGPKGSEMFSTTLRQATAQNADSAIPLTATAETTFKTDALKLPQLRADERAENLAQPANENNTLLLMQSWQRGTRALADGSKQHLPSIIMFCGATLSAMWLAAATVYIHNIVGWQNIKNLMPHEIGGFLAGLLAPVALFWMILTFWLRSVDVKLYAEALRTEIQNMIFPSDEAERRVNNDIERLVRQTAEMSRATRMALGTLQQARQAVQGETKALQDGAANTAERLEALEQRLGDRHRNLAELQTSFEQKSALLEKAAAQFAIDATAFDKLVDQTAGKTTAIGQTLQAPITQLQSWQDDIVDTLNSSLAKITDKQDLLRIDAQDIEDKAMYLADTLKQSTTKLYDFTDDALDKAKLIETRLQGQGLSLQETLQHIAAQTESLTTQRDHLLQELASSSDHGRVELANHVALLKDTTQQLHATHDVIATQMQNVLQQAETQWSNQAIGFNTIIQAGAVRTTDHLTQAQQGLTHHHEVLQQQVIHLNDSVTRLLDNAGQHWSTQADQFGTKIQTDAATHIAMLSQTQTGLQTGYDALQTDLAAVTQKINLLVQQTTQNLQGASATLQNDIIQQHAHTQTFVDTLTQKHREATRGTAGDLVQLQTDLNGLAAELVLRGTEVNARGEQTAHLLRNVQGSLNSDLDRLMAITHALQTGLITAAESIETPLQKLDHAAQTVQDKVQIIGNVLDQRVTNLYELGGALTHQAGQLGGDLATKSQFLENVLLRLNGEIKTINTGLAAQTELLDNSVRVTLSQVNSMLPQIRDMQQNFTVTQQQAEQAQISMVRLSDVAQTESQNLIALSDTTVARITSSLSHYKDLQDNYQLLHQTTLDQHQHMRDAWQQDVEAFSAGHEKVILASDHLGENYKKLQDVLRSLQQEAGQSQISTVQTQDTLRQTQTHLAQTAQQLQQHSEQATQNIRVLQQILDGSAQSALNHIQNFSTSMHQADKQSSVLQERVETLYHLTEKHNGLVEQSAQRLEQATTGTARSHELLSGFDNAMESLTNSLGQQENRLSEQSSAIEALILNALTRLQDHTQTLADTTREAGQRAETIKAQDQALQRDYFFNATKFIVESLHSLALDFTRMLDGELPEKTWKAYQRGDTSVFTKRLVSLRDSLSHDRLRQKFADDVEFRTYVQRYLRQFEEIHEHAKKQDYGDLLSGVFTSSDIGRLYQMLKTIVAD